jgi:hypothetical protein
MTKEFVKCSECGSTEFYHFFSGSAKVELILEDGFINESDRYKEEYQDSFYQCAKCMKGFQE